MRFAAVTCLSCGRVLDGQTGLRDARVPDDGAYSICVYCAHVAVFRWTPFGLVLRPMSEAESDAFAAWPDGLQALGAVRELIRRRYWDGP